MTFNGATEDPWHTATLTAPYTAGSPVPEYRIDTAGNVHLRGHVVRNAAASSATAFTLTDMYWPTVTARAPIWSAPGSSTCRIGISPAGVVALHELSGTVTDYYIDCSFSTY